jgi:hypothetical protein
MSSYATDTFTGDGSKVEFTITFDYLSRDHVTVKRIDNGVATTLTVITNGTPTGDEYIWVTDQLIRVGTAPTSTQELKVERDTPEDKQIVQWADGSYIVAEDLNESDKQWLYNIQELEDQITTLAGGGGGTAVLEVNSKGLPVQVDNTDKQKPEISVEQSKSTDDPNALTSDTRLMSEKAIDSAFKQHVGTGPASATKVGQLRIDNTASPLKTYYWTGSAWVQIQTKGDQGNPGPPPGLQTPSATVTSVPLKPGNVVGDPTAVVSQDANSDLQFQFGIPIGQKGEQGTKGDKGDPGDGVTYKGAIDATTAAEPSNPNNGDFYVNTVDGTSAWTGLSTVTDGSRLIWNANTNQWDNFTPTYASDLGYTAAADKGTITNTNGTDAEIPIVDSTNAGLMSPSQLTTLNTTPTIQQVLDEGNTSSTELWIGLGGQYVRIENNGTIETTSTIKTKSTTAGDAGTTAATKDYVDGAKATAEISQTKPSSPKAGDLWWADTTTDDGGGRLYIYNDGAWVDVSVPGKGSTGFTEPVTFQLATTHRGGIRLDDNIYNVAPSGNKSSLSVCPTVPDHAGKDIVTSINYVAGKSANVSGGRQVAIGYQVNSDFGSDYADSGRASYGFKSNLPAAGNGNTYAFYGDGSAPSYFGGLVGIKTINPAGSLNVQSNTATRPSLAYDTADILNLDYGTVQLALGIDSANPFSSYLQSRDNANGSRPLTLNPAGGNVGVNTPDARVPFELKKGQNGTEYYPAQFFGFAGTVLNCNDAADQHGLFVANRWAGADSLAFEVGSLYSSEGSYNSYFRVRGDGYIGVGRDLPKERLDVKGNIQLGVDSGYGFLQLGNNTSNWSHSWHLGSNGVGGFEIYSGNLGGNASKKLEIGFNDTKLITNLKIAPPSTNGEGGDIVLTRPNQNDPGLTLDVLNDVTYRLFTTVGNSTLQIGNLASGAHSVVFYCGDSISPLYLTQGYTYFNKDLRFGYANTQVFPGVGNTDVGGVMSISPTTGTVCVLSRKDGDCLALNRTGTNGDLISMRKNGQAKGSIEINDANIVITGQASDYRIKKNITPLPSTVDEIKAMNLVNFEYTDRAPGQVFEGFIAHELQEICPGAVTGTKDAVDENGQPDLQGIDYSKLIPKLTRALQEVLAKNEELEERIAALEGA